MDVCSPGELEWALDHGWSPEEISYTGTNLSEADLDADPADRRPSQRGPALAVGARRTPRRRDARVGIRVNPRIGATHAGGDESTYAGAKPTKFGIYPERLDDALEIARRHDLTIDTVHVHSGYLYFSDSLDVVDEMVGTRRLDHPRPCMEPRLSDHRGQHRAAAWACPFRPDDEPLDLDRWAGIMARHLGPLGVTVATEPGEFIAKQTGRAPRRGRDGGGSRRHHVRGPRHRLERALRALRLPDPVLPDRVSCRGRPARCTGSRCRVTSTKVRICSPRTTRCPRCEEGDIVALPNVGSYNASMSSEHCLRGPAASIAFPDRA